MNPSRIKLSARKTLIRIFNSVLSASCFFSVRAALLRLTGSKIGTTVAVHRSVYFFDFGKCDIGNNVTINFGSYIDNRGGIYIGNNVNISHRVSIYTLGHNIRSDQFEIVAKSVVIEDNCWMFPNTLIMPGVRLRRGTVVLPGSVVTKSTQEGDIVAGNPARFLRKREHDSNYKIDFRVWGAM